MSVEMMHLLKNQLKPRLDHGGKYVEVYESIFIENRIDFDCMKMMYLIKFKIYYNFIYENNDINYVETKECLNLTRVRDTVYKYNDTFHHIQYISKVKPPIDRLTYPIYTYIVLSLIILFFGFLFIRTLYKENRINRILYSV
jgi:hypothetical protein